MRAELIRDLSRADNEAIFPVKCKVCKRAPRLCQCAEYRIFHFGSLYVIYADNVATEPVRGEIVGLWQPRKNAKIWRRPQYVDGIILARIEEEGNAELIQEIKDAIRNKEFHTLNFEGREGYNVPNFERAYRRRLSVFRLPRRKKAHS